MNRTGPGPGPGERRGAHETCVVVTVRLEPGAGQCNTMRVRLRCARGGPAALDHAWDLATLPFVFDPLGVSARRVAEMMAVMRRLGCRCGLDPRSLDATTALAALAVAGG